MSESATAVDVRQQGVFRCRRDFSSMATDAVAVCDDRVDIGGGVPWQGGRFRLPHGLLLSSVGTSTVRGAPFRGRNG